MKKAIMTIIFIAVAYTSTAEIFTDEELEKQRWVESRNDNLAVSSAGAIGVAQFQYSTWKWIKKINLIPQHYDIYTVSHQIEAQEAYLLFLYNLHWIDGIDRKRAALASYNYGRRNVLKTIARYGSEWEGNLPQETRNYLKQILG